MTKYVVLARASGEIMPKADAPYWMPLTGTYEAANDEAAIKAALSSGAAGDNGLAEAYLAVPLRSWKPRKVEAKQAFSFS